MRPIELCVLFPFFELFQPSVGDSYQSDVSPADLETRQRSVNVFCCRFVRESNRATEGGIGLLCSIIDEMQKKPNPEHRKILKAFKSDRRNFSAETHHMDRTLEKDAPKGETLQVVGPPLNHLRRQSLLTNTPSPTLSDRRPSRTFLHPEHAKLMTRRKLSLLTPPLERYALSLEETPRENRIRGFISSPLSSSGNSSVNSISTGPTANIYDHLHNAESRRSSTTTNKYSLLDALDLEYALIKAAARGSVGTYSLSQSLQKLTFTQSLAFPALARGLSNKKNSSQRDARGALDSLDSGVNAFAKVTTVLILMLISVLVFCVLYKFIRT